MKTRVKWAGEALFHGESEAGHKVTMDGPPEHGGKNQGPRPMEMLLLGVGGCSSFDVIHILQRGRQDVTGCSVEIDAERVDAVPSVFSKIHLHFRISGNNLEEKRVANAVRMSAKKYCSASIMLQRGGVDVSHSFELV